MLRVADLTVSFDTSWKNGKKITPVKGMNLSISKGESVGIIGKSGCGKTVFATSLIGMVERPGIIESGSIAFTGRDGQLLELTNLPEKKWRSIRGKEISLIFQDSISSLNPGRTIGSQMIEAIRLHQNISKKQCGSLALHTLNKVKLSDPARIFKSYPFELSGGMCQRVMIGMALLNSPSLLIADEPTTALDAKTQAEIVDLFIELREQSDTAIIFISHDMNVVRKLSSRIISMDNKFQT